MEIRQTGQTAGLKSGENAQHSDKNHSIINITDSFKSGKKSSETKKDLQTVSKIISRRGEHGKVKQNGLATLPG